MPQPWRLLALAWVAGFTLIDSSIVSLALPDLARDFNRPVGDIAWIATGFLVALAASLLAAGRLADRYGQRATMAFGAIGFGVTTLLCGIAPSFEILLAARIAQGAFGGVLYTVPLAIAATAFPAERRAFAISIYFTSGASSAVVGPLAGGWLTDVGGWRTVFLVQLPLPLIVLLMSLALLPRGVRGREPFDVAGVLAAGTFIAAATFAMLQLPVPGAQVQAVVVGALAVGALVAFLWIESHAPTPAVKLSIFRNSHFVIGSIAGAAAWFAIMAQIVYVALYLQLGRGFEATDTGLLLLLPALLALAFLPVAGPLVTRLGVQRALLIGLCVLVASAAVALTWDGTTPVALMVPVLLGYGLGVMLTLVASATEALSQFRPDEQGTGSAVFNSLRQLGAGMGVAAPAVAFELAAHGSRDAPAVLAGSSAAFMLRLVVLAIPLVLVVARMVPASTRAARFSPTK